MNKKLFSLLVLLMAAVTGAWADKPTFVNGTKFTADDQFDQIYLTQPTYDYALTTKNAEHCTITFFVGGKEVTGANEGDEVTFTVVADMGWTVDESSVIAQYNVDPSHAGARRMDPEQNPTMDMLDEVSLTHETGTNVWTFKMQSADVLVTVKYEPRLAWKQGETTLDNLANVYYYKGMPFISPRLSNPDGLENVNYVSDTGIATVDANGVVTVNDGVEADIMTSVTAAFHGTDNDYFTSKFVTFMLNIDNPATLTLEADPATGGTVEVVIPESGVIANQDGTYNVIPGTSVTLKATAANGYQLNSWSDNVTADTDDNTVATITVDETATVTATFAAKEYEVDLTVNGDDDQGTEKAKWTGKVGEQGTADNFPITAKTGQMVIANYDGRRKVKSVKAVLVPTYLMWDATKKKWVEAEIPVTFTPVENADGDVTWAAGTYLVEGNVTINGTVQLSGDVELIIKDGAKLNANHIFGDNYSLNIYGQANKSGELNVENSYGDAIYYFTALNVHSCKVNASSSDDYCGGFNDIDEFNLYGGSVDATGGPDGYGLCDIPSLKIWGGEMKAEGKGDDDFSYGITYDDYTTSVTVYGGKLWVKADSQALDPSDKVTFTKDDSSTTGKIQTSNDGTEWTDYNGSGKPQYKYVRVGY